MRRSWSAATIFRIGLQIKSHTPDNRPIPMNNKINHLAVWLLVILHQLIGFGWYAVFGNIWLNLHAKTMTDIENPHDFAPYLIAIIASIFVNYGLAWLITRLNAPS